MKLQLKNRWIAMSAPLALTLLAGCAVGPNFHRPAAPQVTGYTTETLPAQTASANVPGGASQQLTMGGDVTGQWWTLFGSTQLDALVKQSLSANPDLASAEAALRKAREKLYAGEGSFFPSVDGSFLSTREKLSSAQFGSTAVSPSPFTLHNASVNISYTLDVFGGTRREIESLKAQAEAAHFQAQSAYVTLTANVVTTAIQEASLKSQIASTRDILADARKKLEIVRQQAADGAVSKSIVLAQESEVAAIDATLPSLEKQLSYQHNALAALAGHFPSEDVGASFDLATLTLPETVPVSLPSHLVDQRPDIRAAEASLHSASAEIGVTTANMLPQFTLNGTYGTAAGQASNLFTSGTGVWSYGAQVVQPIFRGGTLLHERRAAVAAYDEAANHYRAVVLAAFQDVANTLVALQSDAQGLKAQSIAAHSAAERLEMARSQYAAGAISYVLLLDAQRTDQQARIALVAAQAARYADTAALFVALGGGWWNKSDSLSDATMNTERAQN